MQYETKTPQNTHR